MTQPTTPESRIRPEVLAQIIALIGAQAAVREQLATTAARAVALAFAAVTNFWNPAETTRAVREAVRVVQASQRRMATVTDAYLSRSTTLITGATVRPVGAVDITALRRRLPQDVIEILARAPQSDLGQGPALAEAAARRLATAAERARAEAVAAEEVYGRLADHYRFLVSSHAKSEAEALKVITQRGEIMADTDIALADRAQVNAFFTQRKPKSAVGYRRVLHPELGSGDPPCGLCVVAANQVYRYEELMPLHARCRCTVAAVGSVDDPGLQINKDDLTKIYETAKGTGAKQLKTVRIEINEHGELGPVLTYASQRFRGPREYARTQSRDLEVRTANQLEEFEEQLEGLLDRRSAGDETLGEQIDWYRFKVRELEARLPR